MRVTETHNRGFNMSKLLDYYGRLSMRVMMHHSDITVTSNCTLGLSVYAPAQYRHTVNT